METRISIYKPIEPRVEAGQSKSPKLFSVKSEHRKKWSRPNKPLNSINFRSLYNLGRVAKLVDAGGLDLFSFEVEAAGLRAVWVQIPSHPTNFTISRPLEYSSNALA